MTIDIAKLKALAEAAKNDCGDYVALNDYGMAVPPAVVLELIGRLEVSESMEGLYTSTVTVERAELEQTKRELESHKRMLLSAAVSIGTIGEAMGAEMDDDPSELEGLAAELRKDADRFRFVIDCPIRTMVALSRKATEADFDLSAECDQIMSKIASKKTGD